jgi:hypothetical protein
MDLYYNIQVSWAKKKVETFFLKKGLTTEKKCAII